MWNESHFFLNLNYNDDIKWIQWISFLIKYNSKINTDLLQMLISYLITIILRLKYVFISYQTFIDISCIKYSRLYLIFFNLFFRTQEIFQIPINRYDLMVFIQRQTDCCIKLWEKTNMLVCYYRLV